MDLRDKIKGILKVTLEVDTPLDDAADAIMAIIDVPAIYNFVEAETGHDIGNLNQLVLPVCPLVGDVVAFAADGQDGELTYHVEALRHTVHRDLNGDSTQIIDVLVTPLNVRH